MTEREFERTAARADLCRLLAACYYQPGPEFIEEGLFESMVAAAARVDQDLTTLARSMGERFAAEGLDELLLDYTRLFLGPTKVIAQPYASVWLTSEHTLMQDSTLAVLDLYRQGGFEIDEQFRDLPDHIAVELEFLYLLIFGELRALQGGDTGRQQKFAGLRVQLLREHLGGWVGAFAAAVRTGAKTGFYRDLAALTEKAIEVERRAAATSD